MEWIHLRGRAREILSGGLAATGLLAALGASLTWRALHSPRQEHIEEISSTLMRMGKAQELYRRNNQVYAGSFFLLGIQPPVHDGHHYSVTAFQAADGPAFLLEAEGPNERIVLDHVGGLHVSARLRLPAIPTWKPEPKPGEEEHERATHQNDRMARGTAAQNER